MKFGRKAAFMKTSHLTDKMWDNDADEDADGSPATIHRLVALILAVPDTMAVDVS